MVLVLNLLTGHVSPQCNIAFNDEFTTVNYLDSTESPPSWRNLCQNSCEKLTDEQCDIARTGYEGEKVPEEIPDEESDNTNDLDAEYDQKKEIMSESGHQVFWVTPLVSNAKIHEKTRESLITNTK